jgi:hypothetical protein
MKKYDCPECGAEMAKIFEGFTCRKCAYFCHEYALERITKLKSKLHKMRNCENCANNGHNESLCRVGMKEDGEYNVQAIVECLENDRKHWRMAE